MSRRIPIASSRLGLLLLLAVALPSGCTRDGASSVEPATTRTSAVHDDAQGSPHSLQDSTMTDSSANPNQAILDEVNAAKLWRHAKKTRPIWARLLEKPERVPTLEGEEDVPAGQYLCRGEAGDIWPQAAERLNAKYVATDEVSADGWKKFVPHPDNQGVLAAPIAHAFRLQAKWGVLSGKPGDLLVKNYEDRDVPYPADVWIVDQSLFRATYESVPPTKQ